MSNKSDRQTHTQYSLKHEKESTCDKDENKSQVEDPSLSCHHNPAIAEEFIPPRENLPLPLDGLSLERRLHWCRTASADLTVFTLLYALSFSYVHVLCREPAVLSREKVQLSLQG